MYTYVQRPGCKKENTATYVHTRWISNDYSRIRMARARVHGWVGTKKLRRCRVHGQPTGWVRTECDVVFIGSQPAWTEQPMETRPGVPQNGGNCLVFDWPRLKRDPVHLEGSGVPQNGGNGLLLDLLRSKWRPVDREGCGVPQNGGNGLVLERYGQNRDPVDREGCGVPPNG